MNEQKINAYICPNGHRTITIDIDEGVTPMYLSCRTPNCGQWATSSFYRVEKGLFPQYEWYKPQNLKKLNPGEREHVQKGGLLLRKRTKAEQP